VEAAGRGVAVDDFEVDAGLGGVFHFWGLSRWTGPPTGSALVRCGATSAAGRQDKGRLWATQGLSALLPAGWAEQARSVPEKRSCASGAPLQRHVSDLVTPSPRSIL
jgi:hypothetical protein